MFKMPMNNVNGSTKARLPSCTDIFESENNVVRAIEKKVIEIPLNIIAIMKKPLWSIGTKFVKRKVRVSSREMKNVKIS